MNEIDEFDVIFSIRKIFNEFVIDFHMPESQALWEAVCKKEVTFDTHNSDLIKTTNSIQEFEKLGIRPGHCRKSNSKSNTNNHNDRQNI